MLAWLIGSAHILFGTNDALGAKNRYGHFSIYGCNLHYDSPKTFISWIIAL
jgi:hypothetical protein